MRKHSLSESARFAKRPGRSLERHGNAPPRGMIATAEMPYRIRLTDPNATFLLNFSPNANLDITSCEKLAELVAVLRSAGIDFALAELRKPAREAACRSGVLETLGAGHVFHTIDEAVAALARIDRTGAAD